MTASRTPPVVPGLRVEQADAEIWRTVETWAAAAGHNPGVGDFQHAWELDPAGCLIGLLHDQPATAVSIINYDDGYAHLGSYFTAHPDPDPGLRTATMNAALAHAQDRTIGADAAPDDVEYYWQAGFITTWRTLHFTGPVPGRIPNPHIACTPPTNADRAQMAALDAECFQADRHPFALAFTSGPERYTRVASDRSGRVRGYGLLRPARHGYRIGPLYADASDIAATLFDALCEIARGLDADSVTIDVPDTNRSARDLAESRGLSHLAETIRMYRPGRLPVRPTADKLIYGLTSLNAG
ncbi:GNAT family N-acetyltransferase [Catenulispora yoronensis]|uniref:GNAT family N-acetyltransferase n=1 Tax=Catenulispora yoronensis TaxID=450799 RepID=A0ABP5FKS6_9ACTN